MFTLVGCSSLGVWVKSNLEGLPVWVYEPNVGKNQIAFVGKGTSETEIRARILAHESILDEISHLIGEDITSKHLAELSSRESIEEYNLKVTREFVRTTENEVTIWFLAVADRAVIEKQRSESELFLVKQLANIEKLENQAAAYYRQNNDIAAANHYLEIAAIAASLPVDRGQALFNNAINRFRKIIQKIEITVSLGRPDSPSTTVTLKRGSRRLSPRISASPVVASFSSYNALGEIYKSEQRFVTDENGQFVYRNLSPTLIRKGKIEFTVDLKEKLLFLKELDIELYNEFITIIEGKRIYFEYERIPLFGSAPLLLAIQEYSLQGAMLESTHSANALKKYLQDEEIVTIVVKSNIEDEQQLLEELGKNEISSSYALYGNVGLYQMKESSIGALVAVSGELSLVNTKTLEVIGTTGQINASAVEASFEEAEASSFYRFGLIAATLINRFLFR